MSQESIDYLYSYAWLGSKLGLDRIQELMQRLGNPQDKLRFIHLAGTNGKGSTAAFLSSILQEAGYKTGLYTSPFIHNFHERMQVNGLPMPDETLDRLVAEMRPHADSMEDHPTTFELDTALAFSFFAEMECDIVVLETGMGGGMDATNVIKNPELCVITPIDMDHMEFLGDHIAKIASAKAGIIKPGRPVVSAKQHPEALPILKEVSQSLSSNFDEVDLSKLTPAAFSLHGQNFSFGRFSDLSIRLLGGYQMENASLAIMAIECLNQGGHFTVSDAAIRSGLQKARWPGRFELCANYPPLIIDGGHNAQGAKSLAANLARYFPEEEITFIMGVMADKDLDAILAPILPIARHFYTITPDNPRAMEANALAARITTLGGSAAACEDGIDAALLLSKIDCSHGGVVCYFGSLYSVGAAREAVGLTASTFFSAQG